MLMLSYSSLVVAYDPMNSVVGFNEQGSAVVLHKNNQHIIVLTNFHIIRKGLTPRIKIIHRELVTEATVTILKLDINNDLALLSLQLDKELPLEITSLCVDNPKVYDEVIAIGAGLGYSPFPTKGMVSIPEMEPPNIVILHSAPITFGNSGGGLFKKEYDNYCLIGINSKMSGVKNFPISHMAIAVHLKIIKEFYEAR